MQVLCQIQDGHQRSPEHLHKMKPYKKHDELDDAIDKYLKYIAVFSLLFDMAECGWLNSCTRVLLIHKYGEKTANINRQKLLQAVYL